MKRRPWLRQDSATGVRVLDESPVKRDDLEVGGPCKCRQVGVVPDLWRKRLVLRERSPDRFKIGRFVGKRHAGIAQLVIDEASLLLAGDQATVEQAAQARAMWIGSSRIGSEAHRKASGSRISSGAGVTIGLECNAAGTRRQPSKLAAHSAYRALCPLTLGKIRSETTEGHSSFLSGGTRPPEHALDFRVSNI